ncbi:zinc finger domain-containing protein [Brachybacterium tyrofermentans]|uniref:zinc finger domain-containing protein n=1 Tax=Brachybacterium tyrofermentans TaxID=47848 RepID=UPI003FCF9955
MIRLIIRERHKRVESGSNRTDVYARHGMPCNRCGATILREKFMNRSSHYCPVCQRKR